MAFSTDCRQRRAIKYGAVEIKCSTVTGRERMRCKIAGIVSSTNKEASRQHSRKVYSLPSYIGLQIKICRSREEVIDWDLEPLHSIIATNMMICTAIASISWSPECHTRWRLIHP